MARQKYGVSVLTYSSFTRPELDPLCNGFTVKNTGTTLVNTMGDQLQPGESKSIGGNAAEIVTMNLEIGFTTQAVPPAQIINSATLTQKYFIDEN